MRELRKDTFSRNRNDDAHEHAERVLDIVSLFNTPRVTHDGVMLRVFPITLTGFAKRCHQKVNVFYKGLDTTTHKLLDSQGSILSKTPAQALDSIQTLVGCKICEGAHLDKDCPLNEEVKRVEEVKYGEFKIAFPNNGRNGETQVKRLMNDYHAKSAKEVHNLFVSTGHCKAILADNEAPRDETSSNGRRVIYDLAMPATSKRTKSRIFTLPPLLIV
uniref:Uncharacterized protein n=1 Tax=Tanacetum cinerariifolium TaxID=118510 RepID=A0A699GJ25_TANCI|nr:hypothetical protein [Tanacetum cinerariifolium]